jgi:hypothetical protein
VLSGGAAALGGGILLIAVGLDAWSRLRQT